MSSVPTGISWLDNLLGGGLPKHGLFIIAGNPGAGKTTLCMHFAYHGANKGEACLYVSTAETAEVLIKNSVQSFGLDLDSLIVEGKLNILEVLLTTEADVQKTVNEIIDGVHKMGARRLVIDSITPFLYALRTDLERRNLVGFLYRFVRKTGITAALTVETPYKSDRVGTGVEEFIADGIILMEVRFEQQDKMKRIMRILKRRGTYHSLEAINYEITKEGLIPVNENSLRDTQWRQIPP